MKKNYLFSIMLLLMASLVFSQPTITHNGNAPQIGDIFYISNNEDMLDPGPSGANQSWDYSVINVFSTIQATIMNPANTPFNAEFPGCNQVFHYNGTSTYIYYDLTQSMINHYGEGFDDNPPMIIYFLDPEKEIEYPFSFNDNFSDNFFSSYVYEGMTTHRRGTSNITADAWGSVTTPENTYNNVLRIKNVKTQVDSVWMEGTFVYKTTSTHTNYSWHTGSSHTPVMVVGILDTDFGTSYCNHYTTSSQDVPELSELNDIQIFPNPAEDFIQVSFNAMEKNLVTISIIDLTGKEVHSNRYLPGFLGKQQATIYLNNIDAGLYFLKINNSNKSISKKLVIR